MDWRREVIAAEVAVAVAVVVVDVDVMVVVLDMVVWVVRLDVIIVLNVMVVPLATAWSVVGVVMAVIRSFFHHFCHS